MGNAQVVVLLLMRVVVGMTMIAHGINHRKGGGRIEGTARWFSGLGLRFVFKDGYEHVLALSVICLALATLGPGRASVDAVAGITVTGWAGGGIALGVAVVATAGMLATFWRPHPRR
jgi:putative oxidoreductase